MLAESSTSMVSRGLPAGGGMRSFQVGFKRIPIGSAIPTAISPLIPAHFKRRIPTGRRQAYQLSSPIAATTSVSQTDREIRGSTVRVMEKPFDSGKIADWPCLRKQFLAQGERSQAARSPNSRKIRLQSEVHGTAGHLVHMGSRCRLGPQLCTDQEANRCHAKTRREDWEFLRVFA